jgi:glucose dehydrogenase
VTPSAWLRWSWPRGAKSGPTSRCHTTNGGYDVASPPVLAEVTVDGRERQVVAQASKTGWVFMHDRRTGELLQRSAPFVPQRNLFKAPTAEGVEVAPASPWWGVLVAHGLLA